MAKPTPPEAPARPPAPGAEAGPEPGLDSGVERGVEPGLCARCAHARPLRSARGSVFLRCGRAERDARFVRYPPLPVRECAGFEAG